MVLNRVIGASLEIGSDHGPLIVELAVTNIQNELFFLTPLILLNLRVQVVMPALTALFTNATWEIVSNIGPFHSACCLHK